jgi:hypothetical protein
MGLECTVKERSRAPARYEELASFLTSLVHNGTLPLPTASTPPAQATTVAVSSLVL